LKQPTAAELQELDHVTARYREAVEGYIAGLKCVSQLTEAAKEALTGGGKRLRPVISLLACEAVCGDYERAMPVAAAFEMAHAASLVQDDIIDESSLRHGKLTAHKKYGAVKAILISDSLIFDIFIEVAKLDPRVTRRRLSEILWRIGSAANLTAEGELYEVQLSERESVSEQEYLKLAELKTGSLFSAAAACGAIAAGARERVVEAMGSYGLNLGVAFQIRDDVLDIVGSTSATGKPILKDVQNNATNAVLVHALSRADSYQRHTISSMLYKKWFAMSDVERLMATLEELGSIDYSTSLAKRYCESARECLSVLQESEAKRSLALIATSLEGRSR
jgi:geranylgeranyl pyrophosphate synthase